MARRAIAILLLVFLGPIAVADEVALPTPVLPGQAPQPITRPPVSPLVAVLRQKQADLAQLQQEIRELRVQAGAPQQIMVHVEVLEASLTKMERMGVRSGLIDSGYSQMPCDQAQKLVNELKSNNLAKTLAEPAVVSVDGRPASLHVGEDVPIPTLPGSKAAVEFRPTGTQLDVLPLSLGNNRVRLELKIKVSDGSSSRTVEIYGAHIPVIPSRGIDTVVECAFGDSIVLSGMVETRVEGILRDGKVGQEENRIATLFVVTPSPFEEPVSAQHEGTSRTKK